MLAMNTIFYCNLMVLERVEVGVGRSVKQKVVLQV